ncbi:hypothetical protein [Pontibacter sp. HSC-36F09]|uniref:hypothetical protein n=1 Tax=Pontibacter sp. HSC-36F09 TaxID=2910966 RepID=UPI0020A158FB|nr:hypothetical protein [Pontibacter sp. HSC-36F09]MCP2043490.1 hypothetical protein [Pontibacter sp. HSC-36F09]
MKPTKKSLQKFTETEAKISKLMALESLSYDDLEILNDDERKQFGKMLTDIFNSLQGHELDKFYNKIKPIMAKETKNSIWDSNHNRITYGMSKLMQDFGRMPTKDELANETGLSRQTIHKHLKDYANHPLYLEHTDQFKFMVDKVLAKMFHYAVNGDVSAAKLFLTVVNPPTAKVNGKTLIQTQNNYIQINGTVLSQETLQQLSPEQLNNLEAMLKTALPEATQNQSHPGGRDIKS